MAQVVTKVCRSCGRDVAAEKRVKDAAGDYYCQPCHSAGRQAAAAPAAPPVQANAPQVPTCSSCGAAIAEDAAFCARCGAKQVGGMSVDDEIDVTSLIVELRRYAEHSTVLVMAPGVNAQAAATLRQMAAVGDTHGMAQLNGVVAQAKVQEANCRREAEEFRTRIGTFDRGRVRKIYDLILSNPTVSDTIKEGLRSDALNLFGRSPALSKSGVPTTTLDPVSALTPLAAAQAERDVQGPPSEGSGVRRAKKRLSPVAAFVGGGCLLVSSAFRSASVDSPVLFVTSVLLSFGGVMTLLVWGVMALLLHLRQTRPAKPGRVAETTGRPASRGVTGERRQPIGLFVCLGLGLLGVILLLAGGHDIIETTTLTVFGGEAIVFGIGGVIAALIGLANSCPKCHLLFTSETLNTNSLGTHTESRTEERTARHYHANGGPAYGETKYDVERQVQVTTLVHTKHCKSCGHVWMSREQRES